MAKKIRRFGNVVAIPLLLADAAAFATATMILMGAQFAQTTFVMVNNNMSDNKILVYHFTS